MKRLFIGIILITLLLGVMVQAQPSFESNLIDISNHWAEKSIENMTTRGIIKGFPDGSFQPDGQVTRSQFIKMLVTAMNYKKIDGVSFQDLKPFPTSKPHWACVYIETALRNGVIVKNELGENFFPDIPLTRKEMGIIIYRALNLAPSIEENPFSDIVEGDGYLTSLYENYLIRGTLERGKRLYKPEGLTTRAEATVIISRMLDYKEDPTRFVDTSCMEERLANSARITEDVALNRELEIKKAQANPNFIIQPEIRVLSTRADFDGWEDRADRSFKLNAGYIALNNYEDYYKYTPDTQYKIICTNKDKELLNTGTLLTQPFISYDHVYEVRRDIWESFSDGIAYTKELDAYIIFYIKRDEEKAVNGKWVSVPDYVKKGETLNFKLYLKRGNNTQEYDIKFEVN